MSQNNMPNTSSPLSGSNFFGTLLPNWRDTLYSMHSGTSRPAYAVEGLVWRDTTTNPWILKMYNGTNDIVIGYVDPVTLEFQTGGNLVYSAQTVGGTANALTLSDLKPFKYTLEDGALIFSLPPNINTGAITANVAGTGAKAVKKISPIGYVDMEALDIGLIPAIFYYSASLDFYISLFTVFFGFPNQRTTNTNITFNNWLGREVATANINFNLPLASGLPNTFWFHYSALSGAITFVPDTSGSPDDVINNGTPGASVVAPIGSSGIVFKTSDNKWWVTGIKAATQSGLMFNFQQTKLTTQFTTSSSSYTDVTGVSVTITPTSSTSKVLVRAVLQVGTPTTVSCAFQLVRGSTAIGVATSVGSRTAAGASAYTAAASTLVTVVLEWLDEPATTSATTYKVQVIVNNGSGTIAVNSSSTDTNNTTGTRAASVISVNEVGA